MADSDFTLGSLAALIRERNAMPEMHRLERGAVLYSEEIYAALENELKATGKTFEDYKSRLVFVFSPDDNPLRREIALLQGKIQVLEGLMQVMRPKAKKKVF